MTIFFLFKQPQCFSISREFCSYLSNQDSQHGRVKLKLHRLFAYPIWYIVHEKTPGIIVMLWLSMFLSLYFFVKFPRLIMVWILCIVTQILIVSYELQVRKVGVAASIRTGQKILPVSVSRGVNDNMLILSIGFYELAPYRLACVAGGCFVAFIWTIFPYPLSDRSWLRKDLGSTLYLLANYYAVVHSVSMHFLIAFPIF